MYLEILKKYKIKPKKSLGQNFLINEEILSKISSFLDIKWKKIIEIWPWYWTLTEKLLKNNPKELILIEIDKNMVNILEKRIKNWDFYTKWIDIKIINEDVLKYKENTPPSQSFSQSPLPNPPSKPSPQPSPKGRGSRTERVEQKGDNQEYFVIANIPYNITSPILRHFMYKIDNTPNCMIILMQKDVWDKILWYKKNKSSFLSLFINKKYNVEKILDVSKNDFFPVPKVDSSVLFFKKHNLYSDIDDDKFFKILKMWFFFKRKKLLTNFINWWIEKYKILNIFKKLNIDENIRWDSLDIDIWCRIVKEF